MSAKSKEAAPAAAATAVAEGQQVFAKVADFAQMSPTSEPTSGSPLDFFFDVPVTVTAKLGDKVMPISELLKIGPGAVIELDRDVSQPIELTVRGVPFARGEVVVVEDHFAVRIKTLLSPRGRSGAK